MTQFSAVYTKISRGIIISLYGVLCLLGWQLGNQLSELLFFAESPAAFSQVEGQDWVLWTDRDNHASVDAVHPLLKYKAFLTEVFLENDQLLKINYHEVYKAEVAENISKHAASGKTFIYQIERNNATTGITSRTNIQWVNGYRLSYTFNEVGLWWRVNLWLSGLGTFVAFVVLLILFPFLRKNSRTLMGLGLVVGLGLLLMGLLLGHDLYLIVESDLVNVTFEKVFFAIFSILVIAYSLLFLLLRWQRAKAWLIPSMLIGSGGIIAILLLSVQDMAWGALQSWLERAVLLFFLIHLLVGALLWAWAQSAGRPSRRRLAVSGGISLMAILAMIGLVTQEVSWQEHALFLTQILLFFPLINAAYSQLPFGKVNVVMTKSLQYVIFIAASLFIYVAIRALFDWVLPTNPYRVWLEIISLLLIMMALRALYQANENRFAGYITTSQQQKEEQFKAFVAGIPQYTSPTKLREDVQGQLQKYFENADMELWWGPDVPEQHTYQQFYGEMKASQALWSRSKELSDFRFDAQMESSALATQYSLIAPIHVSEAEYGLLLMGRKKRRVYNLSDLELISQLIQQVQLSLNVLQLLQRERELVEKTYEANLTALRSQINPHFLFNTLNTISSLIHDSPDLAEEAVEKLAFIFRYTLRHSSQNLVSMEDELSLVSTYLEIEKIRFGERLKVQIEMEPEVRERQLPAFVVQTLVENCIKHGIAKIIGKGIVSIDAYQEGEYMICEVYDNGPGIQDERINKGTGLNNILTRLEKTYNEQDLLKFENTGEGTLVRLKVPLSS
jgi:hypothetical protein